MALPPPSSKQSRVIWLGITALAVVALVASVGALVWTLGWTLNLLSPVIWPLAIAAVLAYLLDPVVDFLEHRKVKRQRAIIMVFALAAAVMVGIGGAVVPRLVYETSALVSRIPGYAMQIQERAGVFMEHRGWQLPFFKRNATPESAGTNAAPATNATAVTNVTTAVNVTADTNAAPGTNLVATAAGAPKETTLEQKIASAVVSWLPKALPRIGNWLTEQVSRVAAWLGLLAGIALVPVYCFYFLVEKQGIQRRWTNYLPVQESKAKDEIVFVLTAINDRLIVFFRGQVLVAACDGVLYTIGFFAMGLNYALLLGLIGGVLCIIPYLGAIVTFLIAVVLAAVQFQDWLHPLLVLGVFAVVQTLEGFVIQPKIIGDRVGLHPLTIIVSVMVGTTLLGGILGGVLAIPLTAALRVLMFRYVWNKAEGK